MAPVLSGVRLAARNGGDSSHIPEELGNVTKEVSLTSKENISDQVRGSCGRNEEGLPRLRKALRQE
jgi:hypothetical protein